MPEEPEVAEPSERVYLWNLNYQVSEKQLTDYLSDYGVISVIIPVQPTYGLRRKYVYHLGIAYAQFGTVEQATIAVQELYNREYMGRELKLRYHIPYVPRAKRQATNSSNKKASLTQPNEETDTLNPLDGNTGINLGNSTRKPRHNKHKELSKDTVYCKTLPEGTTDADLREYFKEYSPREIWIFKSVPVHKTKCLPTKAQPYTSALVTLNTKAPLRDVVKSVSKVKLNDKKMTIKPAFLSKIVEVQRVAAMDRPDATLQEESVTEDNNLARNEDLFASGAMSAPNACVQEEQKLNVAQREVATVDRKETEAKTEVEFKERIAPASKTVMNEKLVVVRDPLHTMKLNKVSLDVAN